MFSLMKLLVRDRDDIRTKNLSNFWSILGFGCILEHFRWKLGMPRGFSAWSTEIEYSSKKLCLNKMCPRLGNQGSKRCPNLLLVGRARSDRFVLFEHKFFINPPKLFEIHSNPIFDWKFERIFLSECHLWFEIHVGINK